MRCLRRVFKFYLWHRDHTTHGSKILNIFFVHAPSRAIQDTAYNRELDLLLLVAISYSTRVLVFLDYRVNGQVYWAGHSSVCVTLPSF